MCRVAVWHLAGVKANFEYPEHFMVRGGTCDRAQFHEIVLYHIPPCSFQVHGNTKFPLLHSTAMSGNVFFCSD